MNYLDESYGKYLPTNLELMRARDMAAIDEHDLQHAKSWVLGAFDALEEGDSERLQECLEELSYALGLDSPVRKDKPTEEIK